MDYDQQQSLLARQYIDECRRRFGPAPRSLAPHELKDYLKMKKPAWAFGDGLSTFFGDQERLLIRGNVVWGHIVQANTILFSPGNQNCPAGAVFPVDPEATFPLEHLGGVAHQLFDLKGTKPSDPELRTFAKNLTNEMARPFGLAVPRLVSPRVQCMMSVIFVDRRHLPNGYLTKPFFPMIVAPTEPRTAMILPSKYWPEPLVSHWMAP